jgi:hypothetical protein
MNTLTFSETDTCRFSDYTFSQLSFVGFDILTVVATKTTIFWAVAPCSSVQAHRRFGVTYCFHFEGCSKPSNKPAGGRRQAPKRRLTSTELRRVTSKKTGLFRFHLIKMNGSNKQWKELLLNIKEDINRPWRSLRCSSNCLRNNFME